MAKLLGEKAAAIAQARLAMIANHLTLENACNATVTGFTAAKSYVVEHPIKAAVTVAGVVIPPVFGTTNLLGCAVKVIGFGPLGPIAGTTAAWYQSTYLGGFIPADGVFASLQRVGMTFGV